MCRGETKCCSFEWSPTQRPVMLIIMVFIMMMIMVVVMVSNTEACIENYNVMLMMDGG